MNKDEGLNPSTTESKRSAYNRRYYKKHKPRLLKKARTYREANPDRHREKKLDTANQGLIEL